MSACISKWSQQCDVMASLLNSTTCYAKSEQFFKMGLCSLSFFDEEKGHFTARQHSFAS